MTEKERPEQPESRPADCFDSPPVTLRELTRQSDAETTPYEQRSMADRLMSD